MAGDRTFEGFEDVVEAGWGGFAVVYRARQLRFDREVAIKVLNVRPGSDLAQELARESAAIGSLSGHPNIVTVHGVGETSDGRPYIVMEYLHGGSLGDRVRAHGPLSWKEAAEVGVAVAGALESAHRAGFIHRDVKPENVLMSRFGHPKLGDFGIARLHASASGASGGAAGSLRHLAPEVLDGHPPTIASDVYSLGSTLFTVLTGRPPGAEGGRTLAGVPAPVRAVVEQALSADPAARQSSAEEMGRQLQAALKAGGSTVPELAVDLSPGPASGRSPRRARAVAVAVVSLAVLAVIAALAGRNRDSDIAAGVAALPTTSTAPAPTTTLTATTTTRTTLPPPQPGSFVDDFSGPRAWARSSNPAVFASELVDGQYRLAIFPPPSGLKALPPFPAPVLATPSHMVRIEADATKVSSTSGRFGVGCGGPASQLPYGAVIDADGTWSLVHYREGADPYDRHSGRNPGAIEGPGPHRIALECIGEGDRILLTLWVDGVEVATGSGPRGTSFGPGPGLIIETRVGTIDVLFDNLRIEYR